MASGLSIHIGLNHVDPSAYHGWDGRLAGCINDARDMQAIADGLGYASTLITDSDATAARVVSEIGQAAATLTSGDILLLTYSGHGGQVPDVNGEETDVQDETWVLWDRQLIDDELYALWSRFTSGVRIAMLSDSCHSGTVLRMIATYQQLSDELRGRKDSPSEAELTVLESLRAAIQSPDGGSNGATNGAAAHQDPAGSASAPTRDAKGRWIRTSNAAGSGAAESTRGKAAATAARSATSSTREAATAVLDRATATAGNRDMIAADDRIEAAPIEANKTVPPDILDLVNASRSAENAMYQWIAGPSERATVSASVILISGCQDNQTSLDGARNGLFTEKLKAAWNSGAFGGDYQAFWQDIRSRMPASQQPNYATTGAQNAAFEAQRPFTIEFEGGNGNGSTPTPTPTPIHPTLRRNDRGSEVSYLQQKLVDAGYSVTVDGVFGFYTEKAVVEFQEAHGLSPDGIVGRDTWTALESGTTPQPDDGQPDDGSTNGHEPTNGSPTATQTRPTLRLGDRGSDVAYLQNRLRFYGYNIAADGQFGPMTRSAVQSFQRANGLTVDGVVGHETWEALG